MTDRRFSREVLDLFDLFVHGDIARREFIDRCGRLVGGTVAATATLTALTPDFAGAQVVAPDDRRIRVLRQSIASPAGSGKIDALVAAPADAGPPRRRPVVLVVHENRGLNPHIEDIARRLAIDGFVAVAPDALTALGGYPGDEDKARAAFATLDQDKIRRDFLAAAAWGRGLPAGNGKLGAVGFCYGGGMVNWLATQLPDLAAGVAFYGAAAPLDKVDAIRAELLVHMAQNDPRINAMWPPYEAALKAAGKRYEAFVYPDTEHGFNNDTTPRFDRAAAALAWSRTLALFRRRLA